MSDMDTSGIRVSRHAVLALFASLICLAWAAAPGIADAATPVPLVIDTDIFTNADDVGALASAFALQRDGEAKVIAVTVNIPTSRSAVAPDQWKCVAAIDNFYGAPNIPIGIQTAATGTDSGSSYVGACGPLAPASAPTPGSAVSVDMQALSSQPDGSVVMVSIGYMGNLAALISSSSGRQLVKQKVRELVVMGGGYPGALGEGNLQRDPADAQYVSQNWPTTIVWDGYEVGVNIDTGQTISSVQPANSPVRVAYDSYVGPGVAIPSWDLTAVYEAVRPTNPFLSPAGPGTNVIDGSGGNTFTRGAGDQYYLKLSNPAGLDCSIESLLNTLPGPPAAGQISGSVLDASAGNRPVAGALVQAYDSTGNSVARSQTNSNGAYSISGLPSGCYSVGFSANDYISQYYNGTSALAGAASVSVSAGSPVTGLNAALSLVAGAGAPAGPPTAEPPSHRQGTGPRRHAPAKVVSRGEIRVLLMKLLATYEKRTSISALLKHDRGASAFTAPTAGRLEISLYHAEGHGRKVLVAVAALTFKHAGAATVMLTPTRRGRRLLRGAKRVRLSARASFRPYGRTTTIAIRQLTLKR
jgi:Carboxypeptidase regulatory-like domain/Inosine-uridine preferring nucleoside hydrolase